jgi:hypothetical protein
MLPNWYYKKKANDAREQGAGISHSSRYIYIEVYIYINNRNKKSQLKNDKRYKFKYF